MSTAYCHGCDRASSKSSLEGQPPCVCGGTSFSWSPRKHQTFYALTSFDRTFLRVQRIATADERERPGTLMNNSMLDRARVDTAEGPASPISQHESLALGHTVAGSNSKEVFPENSHLEFRTSNPFDGSLRNSNHENLLYGWKWL